MLGEINVEEFALTGRMRRLGELIDEPIERSVYR